MQYNETISCLSAKRSYNFIKIKIKFYKRFNIFFGSFYFCLKNAKGLILFLTFKLLKRFYNSVRLSLSYFLAQILRFCKEKIF